MRYLSKVIFINSANTPYAEIKLDGNVHFIGTQGVGKSTLLRAILFFYNGDKLKLGIPKEKKGFDEFYLPHSNSYIVFEVNHEYGPFCVLVFRSQGRACFRFIDAPFERDWLIDAATGDVTSEYTVIRQRAGKRYVSRIIDKYDEYRNIIYGNHNATEKEFYKFAVMESPRYQNIPRSLQNVFLNSRVDADFIREIIIRSMNDEEVSIDLGYYRRQVAEFGQEYEDISNWFRTNAKGEIAVRVQADAAIAFYRKLLYHKERIVNLYGELLYALRLARERVPLLEEQAQKQASEIQRYERLLGEEKEKFNKENTDLNKQLGVVEEKLKDIKRKCKHYQEIGIDSIVRRVGAEQDLRRKLDSLLRTRENLTQQFHNLSSKYEVLENGLRSDYQALEASAKEHSASIRENAMISREKYSVTRDKRRAESEASYTGSMELIEERLSGHRLKESDLEKETVRFGYFRPLGQEIDAKISLIAGLKAYGSALEAESANLNLRIEALSREYEVSRTSLERERDDVIRDLDRDAAEFESKRTCVEKLLSDAKGSLYEWLDANRPGWEKTFGKVMDEGRILYSKELKPTSTGSPSDTIFGISLDLSQVESTIRTPAALRDEKAMYEDALAEISKRRMSAELECEKAVTALTDRMSPKMKELRKQRSICEARIQALPQQIKAEETKLGGLQDRQKEILDARKEELRQQKLMLTAEALSIEEEKKNLTALRSRQMKAIEKEYTDNCRYIDSQCDAELDKIREAMESASRRLDTDLRNLKIRRDAELRGAGVDTEALNECEASIADVKSELSYIERHRQISLEYQIEKRDLFDREDEFADTRKVLNSKRDALEDKFRLRGRKLTEQKEAAGKRLSDIRSEKQECEQGITKSEDFQNDSTFFPPYLTCATEVTTMSSAISLVEEVRNAIYSRIEVMDRFKQAVNQFKGNYKTGNTFNFKINITTDQEYLDFASNLEEFVEQNKIEDYRGRTSDRYLEILTRVSREMGEITRHGSEVEKIIRDINYDFKEKNFVGAIRSIQIRSCDSGDKMVQLLLKIKEFSDEYQFHLSGINLFSATDEHAAIGRQAVGLLRDFMSSLREFALRQYLTLSDTFQLQFRVVENDNDTGWVEKIANVGSDGTDILVKAMVNIMLINVFKEKVSRKFGEFRIHCMMDEIGKLHPSNVKGILDFANSRNILLINSSPTTYNVSDYRYTYLLSKDSASKTIVTPLITRKEAELAR